MGLTARVGRDGAIIFVEDGQGVAFSLSRQQVRLLLALLARPDGSMDREAAAAAVWPVADRRRDRQTPLTASQRASLARSVRRLIGWDLVHQPYRGWIGITDEGRRVLTWLMTDWGHWASYENEFPTQR